MAILTVQKPVAAGVALTKAAAAAGGDSFPNTGKEWVEITNANVGVARTVTFDAPGTCSFGFGANAAHDTAVVVDLSSTKIIGPFPTGEFNDANGRVQMTYSSEADLTVAVVSKD